MLVVMKLKNFICMFFYNIIVLLIVCTMVSVNAETIIDDPYIDITFDESAKENKNGDSTTVNRASIWVRWLFPPDPNRGKKRCHAARRLHGIQLISTYFISTNPIIRSTASATMSSGAFSSKEALRLCRSSIRA